MGASEWNCFRLDCIEAMEKYDHNEIGFSEACDRLNKYYDAEKPDDLVQDIWNLMSERVPSSHDYLEVLRMLKNGASEEQIRDYMGEDD